MRRALRLPQRLAMLALPALLGGCDMVVMNPTGDIAVQQRDLILFSTGVMLLIIVPVMVLTVVFARKYRRGNANKTYDPSFTHSTTLELVIWSCPLLIIIALSAVTWTSTHLLDPFRPLERIAPGRPVPAGTRPLEIQAVALDWKWLFIYPEQGVATVNELVVPTGRPLQFKITSSSVMNSFYVPAMAGQIYAMPGMETRLHAVVNKPIETVGFSANYSGAGFSNMRFATHAVTEADFAKWAAGVKANKTGPALDRAAYLELEKPSEKVPVIRFATVAPDLYDAIVDMCVEPGKMCMSEMMALDARGGLGKAGIRNVEMLAYDKHGREAVAKANATPNAAVQRELAWVRALCRQMPGSAPDNTVKAPANLRSLTGAGMAAPQSLPLFGKDEQALAQPKAESPVAVNDAAHSSQISRN